MTPRVADYFCGIGGAALAFSRAGFDPVFGCELDRRAADTYAANHGRRPAGDAAGLDPAAVPDHEAAFVGLPCVGFSTLGLGRGFADRREACWYSALRVVARTRPAVVVVENSAGLARHAGGRSLRFVAGCLRAAGYARVAWRVLDATAFGGAQVRRRVFVVATRGGRRFDFDALPTAPPVCLRNVLAPAAADAYLDPSQYVLLDRPHRCPSGPVFVGYRPGTLWQPGGRLDLPRTHRHLHRIYGADGPAPTLTAQGAARRLWVQTPAGVRPLNLAEWARLMGYPSDFRWPHPDRARDMLGNSVHVPTVAALAAAIREQLF